MPDLAVPEAEQVAGDLPGAERVVRRDHGVAGTGGRVDDDNGHAGRQRERGLVEEPRLQDDDRAVDGLRGHPLVGA
jgi:hypothetical protein